MSRPVPTAEFASLVYGEEGVPLDDPAETFHEASRLSPRVAPGRLLAAAALARDEAVRQSIARASRTHPHRPGIALPDARLPRARLRDALRRRRSSLADSRRPLSLRDLSVLLRTSYGAAERAGEGPRRLVPSGGALYPLELYVVTLAVAGLPCIATHYDPFRHRLAFLREVDPPEPAAALVDRTLAERASALLVVTAVFWRSRFKYGLRGYRFALLEAGHVVQNAVLSAAALGLPALPVGGFYDRRLDRLVGADGLDEASVYAVLLGGRG